jgi:DNA-binding IclR family transcriptional regulator
VNDDPLLLYKIDQMRKEIDNLKADLKRLREEREAEQRKRLLWGIGALGSAVMALAGAIWAMLPASAQEAWEVFRGGAR